MRKILIWLAITGWMIIFPTIGKAQSCKIYGLTNCCPRYFASYDPTTGMVDSLHELVGNPGIINENKCFDRQNGYYIVQTSDGYLAFDTITGAIVDTLPINDIREMFYDASKHRIWGLSSGASPVYLKYYDIATATTDTIGVLPGVTNVINNNTAFATHNGHYYVQTNLGIVAIDTATALVVDTLPDLFRFMYYHEEHEALYGIDNPAAPEYFLKYDIQNDTLDTLALLGGVTSLVSGKSVLDQRGGYYYTRTNLGATVIDISDGSIVGTATMDLSFMVADNPKAPTINVESGKVNQCEEDTTPIILCADTGYVNYLWSTGETTRCITVDTTGVYKVSGSYYTTGCMSSYSESVVVEIDHNCEWPGDSDEDGIVFVHDLLRIGLAHGATGPVRANATSNWVGQPAPPWPQQFIDGVNYKHADCNGDGAIDDADAVPIDLNYSLTHSKTFATSKLPGLNLFTSLNQDTVKAGDTLNITVKLGSAGDPVDSIYGLAFSMMYDNTIVDSGSVQINFDNCWIGEEGVNLLTLVKDFPNMGQVDIGLTRTDHTNVSGYGEILQMVVIIDNLAGKRLKAEEEFFFTFSDVLVVSASGDSIETASTDGSAIFFSEDTNSNAMNDPYLSSFHIYPNPANTVLYIAGVEVTDAQLELYDALGQLVHRQSLRGNNQSIVDVSTLPNGLYFLHIQQANGQVLMQKITIMR